MNKPIMETLARRLDRLERENRRLKRAGKVALAVIATVVLMGVHVPPTEVHDVVEAKRFVLRDENLSPRGKLGLGPAGLPRLTISGKDPKAHLAMFMTSNDEAVLRFNDKQGMIRVLLGSTHAGSPSLTLFGKDGKVIWTAP